MANTILRLSAVKVRTGLSRSCIYQRVAEGSFPKQVSLGPRAIGWVEAEIEAWVDSCIKQSRGKMDKVLGMQENLVRS